MGNELAHVYDSHRKLKWIAGLACAVLLAIATTNVSGSQAEACCPILELRQYTIYPGKRDALIALFEESFIESQEATGITLVAQFRDINNPNRFVWIRGFAGMAERERALNAFYSGSVWRSHRDAANAMLFDNDDVLLLHPAAESAGFALSGLKRAAASHPASTAALVVATIYYLDAQLDCEFLERYQREAKPLFERAGARILAELVTEKSVNNFPRLPVREGENVFVTVARFGNRSAYGRYLDALAQDERWSKELFPILYRNVKRPPEVLMLEPTPRSMVGRE